MKRDLDFEEAMRAALRLAIAGAGAALIAIAVCYPMWAWLVNVTWMPVVAPDVGALAERPGFLVPFPASGEVVAAIVAGVGLIALARLI